MSRARLLGAGALAAGLLAAGCDGKPRDPRAPVAMTVTPVGSSSVVTTPSAPGDDVAATSPLQIAFAGDQVCVRSDGAVYCQRTDRLRQEPLIQKPHRIDGVDDAVDLAGVLAFLCVVTRRGTVMCRGSNEHGELGAHLDQDRSDTFVEVHDVARARRVATGPHHACAILEDKSVKCWGRNDSGETGSDTAYRPAAHALVGPTLVPGVKAEAIAAGISATCAVTPERTVLCWGANDHHVRPGGPEQYRNERPTRLPDLDDVTAVYARNRGYCALRRGEVLCWGDARALVRGADWSGRGPLPVPGIGNATALGLADGHACALLGDGRVSCFGHPYTGALGRPSAGRGYDVEDPGAVEGLPPMRGVSVAGMESCALARDGDLYCWGHRPTEVGGAPSSKPVPLKLR